jgi:hypothetical protein
MFSNVGRKLDIGVIYSVEEKAKTKEKGTRGRKKMGESKKGRNEKCESEWLCCTLGKREKRRGKVASPMCLR